MGGDNLLYHFAKINYYTKIPIPRFQGENKINKSRSKIRFTRCDWQTESALFDGWLDCIWIGLLSGQNGRKRQQVWHRCGSSGFLGFWGFWGFSGPLWVVLAFGIWLFVIVARTRTPSQIGSFILFHFAQLFEGNVFKQAVWGAACAGRSF